MHGASLPSLPPPQVNPSCPAGSGIRFWFAAKPECEIGSLGGVRGLPTARAVASICPVRAARHLHTLRNLHKKNRTPLEVITYSAVKQNYQSSSHARSCRRFASCSVWNRSSASALRLTSLGFCLRLAGTGACEVRQQADIETTQWRQCWRHYVGGSASDGGGGMQRRCGGGRGE